MKKFIRLLAMAGMTAGLLAVMVAPSATASSGDPKPDETEAVPSATAHTTCVVSGQVTAPATPEGTVGHSNYQFRSAILECVDTAGNPVTYDVFAKGASWGPIQGGVCPNPGVCEGSSTAVSWSDQGNDPAVPDKYEYGLIKPSCDTGSNANKGLIESTEVASGDLSSGYVKFSRQASQTLAWGAFCDGPLAGEAFTSDLLFTPTGTEDTKDGEIRDVYDLNGTAVIYTP